MCHVRKKLQARLFELPDPHCLFAAYVPLSCEFVRPNLQSSCVASYVLVGLLDDPSGFILFEPTLIEQGADSCEENDNQQHVDKIAAENGGIEELRSCGGRTGARGCQGRLPLHPGGGNRRGLEQRVDELR